MLLGVDVGGTFTDAVLFDGETVHTAKLPTTPEDQSAAVLGAVEEGLGRGATRGFAGLLEIGRQDRPELYRLCAPKPAPLVEPELRFEAAERTGPEGVLEPLATGEPQRPAAALRARGAGAGGRRR